jgi:hypothetical protein
MAGHILKVAGAKETGEALDVASEKLTEKYPMAPEYQEGFVKRGLLSGVESVLPSVAAGLPGAAIGSLLGPAGTVAGGIIGYALSGGVAMGLSEYQNYKDEHKKEFGTEPDASVEANALLSGAAEAGFEIVSNFVGGKLVLGVARKGAADTIKGILQKPLKQSISDYLKIVGTEVSTEVATAIAQAKARQNTGMETAGMLESGAEAIIPSVAMSSIFMAGGIGLKKMRNARIETALSDPAVDIEARSRAAIDVRETILSAYVDPATGETSQFGTDTAEAWEQYSVNAMESGKPISLDLSLDPISLQAEATLVKSDLVNVVSSETEEKEAPGIAPTGEPVVDVTLEDAMAKDKLAQEQPLPKTEETVPPVEEIIPVVKTEEIVPEKKALTEEQKVAAKEATNAIFKFEGGKRGKKEIKAAIDELQSTKPELTTDEIVGEFFKKLKPTVTEETKVGIPLEEARKTHTEALAKLKSGEITQEEYLPIRAEWLKAHKVSQEKPAITELKTKISAKKEPPMKGAQNMETRIQELGGIKHSADYNTKLLKEDVSKKTINNKTGLAPDAMASQLIAEGFPIRDADHMVQMLQDRSARKLFVPEKAETLMNREIKRTTNEWADEQARLAEEGIDAGTIEAHRSSVDESVTEKLRRDLEEQGFDPETIEQVIAEAKDITSGKKETPKGDFPTGELEGMGEKDTFGLAAPETEWSKPISEQEIVKNQEMFGTPEAIKTTTSEYSKMSGDDKVRTAEEFLKNDKITEERGKITREFCNGGK